MDHKENREHPREGNHPQGNSGNSGGGDGGFHRPHRHNRSRFRKERHFREHTAHGLPHAAIERKRWFSLVWLVPAAALGLGLWFAYQVFWNVGPNITVAFSNGDGLKSGNTEVRFRGVKVGTVKSIELSKDQNLVLAHIELSKTAGDIARAGSVFWIVRPEVRAGSIQGLGTIVSGDYVQVIPGAGGRTNRFIGAAHAPAEKHKEEGGLDIEVMSGEKGSLERSTPVFYRGIEVGFVQSVGLSTNSRTVNAMVHIQAPYGPLVRLNSKFWNSGGFKLNFGLFSGAHLQSKSLNTLFSGGISFATPDIIAPGASNGVVFRLYDKAEDDWGKWNPDIPLPSSVTNSIDDQPDSREAKGGSAG